MHLSRVFGTGLSAAFTLLFLASGPVRADAIELSKPVKEITVQGCVRANQGTVRFYIRSKINEPYSVQETREDIRRIYKLGYFDDVSLSITEKGDGLSLEYRVKEKPFVRAVTVKGVKEVPEKDLQLLISLKKGNFFQQHLVNKDVKKIKAKYLKKGFYFTEVRTAINNTGNNQVDVEYNVDERQKVKIGQVRFIGNRFLKDYDLAEVMESREVTMWSALSETGAYQREMLKVDLLRVESHYRDFGFIKARLEEPRVEVDRENGVVLITVTVHEGDQYRVGKVGAEGDAIHTADEMLARFTLKEGEPFNQSKFRASLFDITELYGDDGYAYATPVPDVVEHADTKTVDITIKVDPGRKIYIGRIDFTGNMKSNDNVVRREFRLREGDRFSGKKLNRSRERLVNTGFFSNADIEQRSGAEPDLMDLGVNLVEKETGNIRAGLGYSSGENLMLNAQVSENNFLGTGRRLSVGVNSSTLQNDYYLDFTEPRWRDRDISLGYQLFARQYDYLGYTSNSTGFGVTAGYAMGEYTYTSLSYKLEKVRVGLNDPSMVGSFISAQMGERMTSSLTHTINKDMRDNFFNPTNGYRLEAATQLAGGPLGGEVDFVKLTMGGSRYFSLPYGFVLMGRGEMKFGSGYGGKPLPISEHYFLGGPMNLRGFTFYEVGPMDTNGQSIGGDSSLLFSAEMSYNFTKAIEGVVFYDRGQIYGADGDLSKTTATRYDVANMRHSVGWGLRFVTPAMPIWLAWGFKLDQKTGESAMEFHFTMGRAF